MITKLIKEMQRTYVMDPLLSSDEVSNRGRLLQALNLVAQHIKYEPIRA